METTTNKNAATLIHLSALTQYFFPFGNFIFPIVIWSSMKKNSDFVDDHGRQAINFQLSLFLYTVILCIVAIPILLYTIFSNIRFVDLLHDSVSFEHNFDAGKITGIAIVAIVAVALFGMMKVAEFFLIIYASVKAAYGELYRYPLTIDFIRPKIANATFSEPEASVEESSITDSQ